MAYDKTSVAVGFPTTTVYLYFAFNQKGKSEQLFQIRYKHPIFFPLPYFTPTYLYCRGDVQFNTKANS